MTLALPAYELGQEPGLWSDDHQPLPLKGIHVDTDITYPVAVTRLTQHYRNERRTPIEARYVFPVPIDALITALEIRIGERTLKGVVKARQQAEREYEDAIVKGDSGFLLTRLDDGLYQVSVGNILPKEEVHLTVHWAELLRWNGNEIRYRLPNLVGPTYGDPQRAGIAPADAPVTAAGVRHPFSIAINVMGPLATARCASPSHALAHQALPGQGDTPARTQLTLQGGDVLDRAFTLTMITDEPEPMVTWRARDGEDTALLTTFYLQERPEPNAKPHHLTLVVDCSGSMAGVSIDQARVAALRIIDSLREGDTLSLVRFGSDAEVLTAEPLRAGAAREALRGLCRQLEADMGGTEMQTALQQALRVTPAGGDLMLITDGECYFSETDIDRLARTGRRLFTIGVGHATSEKVLRRLAEASGGFCELVSPGEDMAGHIVSHFRRLRLPRLQVKLRWPGERMREHVPATIFPGDTAVFSATLRGPVGEVVCLELPEDVTTAAEVYCPVQEATGDLAVLLPRLAAWLQLPRDHVKEAAAMAERYQLVTEHTSMIAVLARATAPGEVELPEVVEVPQMRPHVVNACMDMSFAAPLYSLRHAAPAAASWAVTDVEVDYCLAPRSADLEEVAELSPQQWLAQLGDAPSSLEDFVETALQSMPVDLIMLFAKILPLRQDDEALQLDRIAMALAVTLAVLAVLHADQLRARRPLRAWLAARAADADAGTVQALREAVAAAQPGLTADTWGRWPC